MMGGHEAQGEIIAAYELHKNIPNCEFILNPECWHAAPREHPEYFNCFSTINHPLLLYIEV